MQCYICGGEMKKIKKDVEATWKGRTIIFRGMDAWVCEACGEQAYEPEDVRLMQGLIQGTLKQAEYPEIMNVEEVADLLRVSNQTVYNLVRNGKLPATKIGREWRFSRTQILALVKGEDFFEQAVGLAAREVGGSGISANDTEIIQKHLAEMGQVRG
ncbi:MAG: helix-turn-helix domain-containing protein [Moorella humiferrea]|uniref:helix-turn-helix domain-containing protein n=1 Tax=Neomoorella humiferrea TaxID=676965 RepID=UPI001A0AB68D|nr:helix-turn-helix domain-containing protein [Moorella humiferrea]